MTHLKNMEVGPRAIDQNGLGAQKKIGIRGKTAVTIRPLTNMALAPLLGRRLWWSLGCGCRSPPCHRLARVPIEDLYHPPYLSPYLSPCPYPCRFGCFEGRAANLFHSPWNCWKNYNLADSKNFHRSTLFLGNNSGTANIPPQPDQSLDPSRAYPVWGCHKGPEKC